MATGSMVEFGNPNSVECRWCGRTKLTMNGARLCESCDAPDHVAPTWQGVPS